MLVPFDDLIVHLKGYAKTLVEAGPSDIQLAVFGLVLTDPPLESAHG
ncbi:hypothetical protein [uncultured Brevundimonas sp.]|nr:hypothetical protein [uncultured Brevundimonas sp.]